MAGKLPLKINLNTGLIENFSSGDVIPQLYTGALLTDQTTPQTCGTIVNRLSKLYTTDLDVLNPIVGNGSLLTGLLQSQIAGLTIDDTATFTAIKINADNTGLIYKGASLFIHDYTPAGITYRNTFLGRNAGNQSITHTTGNEGWYNTGIGDSVLTNITKGYQNTALSAFALNKLTEGYYNNMIGYYAGYNITIGNNNNAMGNTALAQNQTGIFNCAMGQGALNGVVLGGGTAINYNTAVGGLSNYKAKSTSATTLGYAAGYYAQANNTLFLGNRAGYYETAANTLIIDTLTRTDEADQRAKALIYGIFAATTNSQYLYLNGNVIISNTLKSQSYIAADGSVGVSGSFTTADSKTVTVKNGIITGIV